MLNVRFYLLLAVLDIPKCSRKLNVLERSIVGLCCRTILGIMKLAEEYSNKSTVHVYFISTYLSSQSNCWLFSVSDGFLFFALDISLPEENYQSWRAQEEPYLWTYIAPRGNRTEFLASRLTNSQHLQNYWGSVSNVALIRQSAAFQSPYSICLDEHTIKGLRITSTGSALEDMLKKSWCHPLRSRTKLPYRCFSERSSTKHRRHCKCKLQCFKRRCVSSTEIVSHHVTMILCSLCGRWVEKMAHLREKSAL